ncbi:MAG: class I SAM-dependent methyltransferase [Candidatus Syntropharchaeia archaeon]
MNVVKEFFRGKNVGRVLFNKLVEKHVKLKGITLDLGCTQRMSYYRFMDTSKTKIFMADFMKTKNVSLILDLEKDLPFKDNSVDNIILFSVLEHIYDPHKLLKEIHRVLKRGGKFYMSIPFMVCYHPSPHDYNRFTKEKLERMLEEFSIERIETIGGFFTVFNYGFSTYFLDAVKVKPIKNLICYALYTISQALDKRVGRIRKEYVEKFPLGYFVVARK